jgi:hypothetical protein
MNKKLIVALIATAIAIPTTAQAAMKSEILVSVPTLAILDTALDTSLPIFQGKIAHEVCILDWNSCPNGTSFMEGPGSSVLPLSILSTSKFNHGTQMASAAITENPNMKIVFVRIIGNTANGARQLAGPKSVANALKWVYDNKSKYNIQAVSMSQGHHNLLNLFSYCPTNGEVDLQIRNLKSINVPSFFAAGNAYDYKRVDWPACQPYAIAIGATDQYGEIESYSNVDLKQTSFYAKGSARVFFPSGSEGNAAGTSVSTQIAAAQWIALKSAKPLLSYQEIYNLLKKTGTPTKNAHVSSGILINIGAAING